MSVAHIPLYKMTLLVKMQVLLARHDRLRIHCLPRVLITTQAV